MNQNERLQPPPENEHCEPFQITTFEVRFAIPVWITAEDQDRFVKTFEAIIRAPYNQLKDGPHWLAGCGSKPNWSQVDSMFMGKPVDPNAPETGEPTFDDETYFMESEARDFVSEEEREKTEAKRAKDKQ